MNLLKFFRPSNVLPQLRTLGSGLQPSNALPTAKDTGLPFAFKVTGKHLPNYILQACTTSQRMIASE